MAALTTVALGDRDDVVPTEEPLELVVDDVVFVVLMRTPTGVADDLALAAGFLAAEGIIEDRKDLKAIAPCSEPNRVRVRLAEGVRAPTPRPTVATSACGVCGTDAIARVQHKAQKIDAVRPSDDDIVRLSERARGHQALFAATGAVHGAALFRGAELVLLREDVGRHNATDKVLGRMLLDERSAAGLTLWVSGRVAFEIVDKALVAGVGAIVAVGGPTSLAVSLAKDAGLPLIAFVRGARFNVYS